MELTPTNLQFLFQAANFRFQQAYDRRKTYQEQYAEQMPSGTEVEVYPWLAEVTGMRKWIGPRMTDSVAARSYSLTNVPYEKTIGLDRDKILDDQFGVFNLSVARLGEAGKRWPDDLVTAALIAGTTALCYDGQAFFSSAHPVDIDDASAGTYSNKLDSGTSGALPLNNPATYLQNFATAYAAMMSFKGESGVPLEVQPTILMVPPQLQEFGMLIEHGTLTPMAIKNIGGVGGSLGPDYVAAAGIDNMYQGLVKCIVNPRLAVDANTWYLLSTDRIKPLVFQLRKAVELIQITDPTSPNVFNQRQFLYGIDSRGAAGYTLPFLAIRAST
jgi:phage major head subunit gpT-like protein